MKVELINNKEKKIDLSKEVWEREFNEDLVAQAIYVFQSNQRAGTAHVKTRGDVAGGGRKPWKQKGTGRARQGSIRSPLWYKGGVTFGPSNERNWKKKLNKKMNKIAISCALSEMLRRGLVSFVSLEEKKEAKSARKEVANIIKKGMTLVTDDKNYLLGLRNVESANALRPSTMNIFDVTAAKNLVIDEKSVELLENRLKI